MGFLPILRQDPAPPHLQASIHAVLLTYYTVGSSFHLGNVSHSWSSIIMAWKFHWSLRDSGFTTGAIITSCSKMVLLYCLDLKSIHPIPQTRDRGGIQAAALSLILHTPSNAKCNSYSCNFQVLQASLPYSLTTSSQPSSLSHRWGQGPHTHCPIPILGPSTHVHFSQPDLNRAQPLL